MMDIAVLIFYNRHMNTLPTIESIASSIGLKHAVCCFISQVLLFTNLALDCNDIFYII